MKSREASGTPRNCRLVAPIECGDFWRNAPGLGDKDSSIWQDPCKDTEEGLGVPNAFIDVPRGRRVLGHEASEGEQQPNGARLSCAAVLWFSQLQFYYDGRRQLQPLVRLRS